ncbi:MAG: VWA domain-containing protein [Nitrospirota bacterium]|jgi:hypothetical protein
MTMAAHLVAMICWWLTVTAPATAEPPRQLLFLVDASTSMGESVLASVESVGWWQRIVWRIYSVRHTQAPAVEASPKIDIVRGALGEFVADLPANTAVGLRVFGQRRWLGCEDSERLIDLGPLDVQRFRRTLNRVQPGPEGRTPLAYAVRESARDFLDRPHGRNTLIVFTDGGDWCPAPLPVGDQLARSEGINLAITVLGFGGTMAHEGELSRLTAPTGGLYLTVRDGISVELGLKRAVPVTPAQQVAVALHLHPESQPIVAAALLAIVLLLVMWWLVRSER